MEKQIINIVKRALPAVVSITVSQNLDIFSTPLGVSPLGIEKSFIVPKGKKNIKIGGGSGFIVDKSGIILTNRHVVDVKKAEYFVILNNGEKHKAEILAKDLINDIAILKIQAKGLVSMKLGDSSSLKLGQTAIAIGNTLGIFQNTISKGVVSGLSREITASGKTDMETQKLVGLIQTDAAINPGNSGGPLIDIQGNVIGINAAMVHGAENIGFALPINPAKRDLKDLKIFGKIRSPFLGIKYIILDKEVQKKYKTAIDHGALVISRSLPKIELKEKDIILEAEKEKVSFKKPLEQILQKFQVNQIISLKIFRDNKEIYLKIKIGERK